MTNYGFCLEHGNYRDHCSICSSEQHRATHDRMKQEEYLEVCKIVEERMMKDLDYRKALYGH